MDKIFFSVVITTYKRSEKLSKAIESILKQSYDNFELIIVDDNGKGTLEQIETEKIIKRYLNNKKVKYLIQDENQGANIARNLGISKSLGEYILFLDDDDEFLLNKLEKFNEVLVRNNKVALIYSGANFIEENKVEYKFKTFENNKLEILKENYIGSNSFVGVKKEIFEKVGYFQEELKSCQDWDMWIRIIENNYLIYGINEPLVNYYIDINEKNRITNNVKKAIQGHKYIYHQIKEKYLDNFSENEKEQVLYYQERKLMELYYENFEFFNYRLLFKKLNKVKRFNLGKQIKFLLTYFNLKTKGIKIYIK